MRRPGSIVQYDCRRAALSTLTAAATYFLSLREAMLKPRSCHLWLSMAATPASGYTWGQVGRWVGGLVGRWLGEAIEPVP